MTSAAGPKFLVYIGRSATDTCIFEIKDPSGDAHAIPFVKKLEIVFEADTLTPIAKLTLLDGTKKEGVVVEFRIGNTPVSSEYTVTATIPAEGGAIYD